jgi:MraZ protein
MFQGAAALNLDAKGRLGVPTRFREELVQACGGSVIITVHPHRCLLIYPEPIWGPIRDEVLARSSLDEASAKVRRLFVGNANPETLDTAGRLLIAPELRTRAQLEKKVWLVGQGDHFELWSDLGWEQQQEDSFGMDLSQLPPGLEKLRL